MKAMQVSFTVAELITIPQTDGTTLRRHADGTGLLHQKFDNRLAELYLIARLQAHAAGILVNGPA